MTWLLLKELLYVEESKSSSFTENVIFFGNVLSENWNFYKKMVIGWKITFQGLRNPSWELTNHSKMHLSEYHSHFILQIMCSSSLKWQSVRKHFMSSWSTFANLLHFSKPSRLTLSQSETHPFPLHSIKRWTVKKIVVECSLNVRYLARSMSLSTRN